jgi:CRP/FNR family transcriptional regulator, cyclic AMP receptor protein
MMYVAQAAGYVAAVLVFLTFYMKTMIPLRIVGICSNFAFIVYGFLGVLYPVLVLHLILLPLNIWRLREMLRLTKQVREAANTDLNMDWLKPFTTARRFQAGDVLFRKGEAATTMLFVLSGRYRVSELAIDILPGQVLGELAWLAPNNLRTQTVECTEDGELLQITYDQVRQLYYQNPQFGFYFLQLSSRRLFDNIARLENELSLSRKAAASAAPG